jgi:aminoglycoside/choline kinase family phosphotransferase
MYPDSIGKIAEDIFSLPVSSVKMLPVSGSSRRYYRIFFSNGKTIIATKNSEKRENKAFLEFAKHFLAQGLPVPEILYEHADEQLYFQSDLGSDTLYDFISVNGHDNEKTLKYYKSAADYLLKFQFCPPPDYSLCFPRDRFDRTSMMWDLNYFKYYFLKLANVPFDEQKLENDFISFCNVVEKIPASFFMYRDFQSRNIIVSENNLYFVDFQGGRQGPLQYDLASLLYDAKANLSSEFRKKIFDYYIEKLSISQNSEIEQFSKYYFHFVLLRIMQAFGAYGYRGYYEKKPHFLQSVPLAAANIKELLGTIEFGKDFPELLKTWEYIASEFSSDNSQKLQDGVLNIEVSSFSFRKGYPLANPDHGGGFVFDCRALPNPGREECFKTLTGKDTLVSEWLSTKNEVSFFLDNSFALVSLSIDNYLQRKFNHLSVAFGCTGGQHRSVYCAERMAKMIQEKYGRDIRIKITHREFPF